MLRFIYFALNPILQDALLFCYLESAKRFLLQNYFNFIKDYF